jgi:GT2 family glycosyltransferase
MIPSLSIIIVTSQYDGAVIEACLASLPRNERTQVIVSDNQSIDHCREIVTRQFPWVTLLAHASNYGYAWAMNRGLERATGAYVCFLNPDTIVHAEALERCVDDLFVHPNIGIVGPRTLHTDGSVQLSGYAFPSLWRTLLGACLVMGRGTALALGGFDEAFPMYSEDLDLCYRATRRGNPVSLVASACITHIGNQSNVHRWDRYQQTTAKIRAQCRWWQTHRPSSAWCYRGLVRLGAGVRWMLYAASPSQQLLQEATLRGLRHA